MEGKDPDESLLFKVKSHFTVTRSKRSRKHTQYTFNVYDVYATLIHTVEKRYREIYSFHCSLSKLSTIIVSETLPPKTMWKNCVDVVQQRKYAFETYLNSLLELNPVPHKDLICALAKFLNVKETLVYRLFPKNISMFCGLKSSYKCTDEKYGFELFDAFDWVNKRNVLLKKYTGSHALRVLSEELTVAKALRGKFRGLNALDCFEDVSARNNNNRCFYVCYSNVNGTSLATFRDRLLSSAHTVSELEQVAKNIAGILLKVLSKLQSSNVVLLDINVQTVYFVNDDNVTIVPISFHLCQGIPKNSQDVIDIPVQVGLSHGSFRHPSLQSSPPTVDFVPLDQDSLKLCDIWSIGTIVYYFAVGRDPFNQENRNLYSKFGAIEEYALKKKSFSFHYNPLLSRFCKDWISRIFTEDLNSDSNFLESLGTHIWLS